MSDEIRIKPLTSQAFAPFGDVIGVDGAPDKIINQGLCGRFHDRAKLDFGNGQAGISLFNATPRELPLALEMVERHPEGSQAFIPMSEAPFLIVVAPDLNGRPDTPLAFRTNGAQAVNYHRNIWHGVLCPLSDPGLFAVIDRIGTGDNLVEHWFDHPYRIVG